MLELLYQKVDDSSFLVCFADVNQSSAVFPVGSMEQNNINQHFGHISLNFIPVKQNGLLGCLGQKGVQCNLIICPTNQERCNDI